MRQVACKLVNRHTDWAHYAIVLFVFSITGSLSLFTSRTLLNGVLGLEGGVWSGPWAYRIAYLLLIPPIYSVTLVVIGTLLGKHTYFKHHVLVTWGRLVPRSIHNRRVSREER